MRPKDLQPVIKVPCPTCSGTGNHTQGGGRNNLKDTCTACAGTGMLDPRTGELPHASFDPSTGKPGATE